MAKRKERLNDKELTAIIHAGVSFQHLQNMAQATYKDPGKVLHQLAPLPVGRSLSLAKQSKGQAKHKMAAWPGANLPLDHALLNTNREGRQLGFYRSRIKWCAPKKHRGRRRSGLRHQRARHRRR